MKKVGSKVLLVLIAVALMAYHIMKSHVVVALIMLLTTVVTLIMLYSSICRLETTNDIYKILIQKYERMKVLKNDFTKKIEEEKVEELQEDIKNLLKLAKSTEVFSYLNQRQKRKLQIIEKDIDGD